LLFLLAVLPVLAVLLLVMRVDWLRRRSVSGRLLRFGLGLMLGAGLAMGAEMLARQGTVTNFLAFGPFPAHWTSLQSETYNIADLAADAGEVLFLLGLLWTWAGARRSMKRERHPAEKETDSIPPSIEDSPSTTGSIHATRK
jgi:lipoprotein signal peptidase